MAVAYFSSDTLTGIRTPLCRTSLAVAGDGAGTSPGFPLRVLEIRLQSDRLSGRSPLVANLRK